MIEVAHSTELRDRKANEDMLEARNRPYPRAVLGSSGPQVLWRR